MGGDQWWSWRRGCTTAGGLVVLVRCRRGRDLAGALPRLALGVVSERASTGRVAAASGWALGLWVAWDARIWVRAGGSEASAFPTGSRHQRRSVRPQAREGRILGALCVGVGRALLPSRGTVHEKGEALTRLTPPAVDMPPVERSEGGRSTDGTQKRRSLSPSRVQPAARDPRPARSPTARSRPSRNAAPRETAPTQPHLESKPRGRSPTRGRTHADAPAGRGKSHPHQGETA